jgi:hypothetical protein
MGGCSTYATKMERAMGASVNVSGQIMGVRSRSRHGGLRLGAETWARLEGRASQAGASRARIGRGQYNIPD